MTDLLCKLYEMPWDELIAENSQHFADASMEFFLALHGEKAVGVTHGSLRHEYINGANDGIKGYLGAIRGIAT